MAYFPNGTSGMVYQEKYCSRCKNWKDLGDGRGAGCPIWDLHTVYNYDQTKNEDVGIILSTLIPSKGSEAQQCSMFDCMDGEIEGQQHF